MNIRKVFILVLLPIILLSLFILINNKNNNLQKNKQGPKIITTLFPLYDFTKNVVQDKANVYLLLPPGVEPHSYEPKFSDITKINRADILIYTNKYMEPWIADIIKGLDNNNLIIIDSSKGIYFKTEIPSNIDPHIWLDFSYSKKMIDNLLQGLIRKDPKNAVFYTKNADNYKAKLDNLDNEFKTGLKNKKYSIIVGSGHSAFGYLAKKYNFKYLTLQGFSPDSEPTVKHVSKSIKFIKENNIKYIYYEELLNPKLATTISKETGVKILMLNAAHNIKKSDLEKGVSFISIMKNNLNNLKTGLGCQ